MVDKIKYWESRKQNKRGQEALPEPTLLRKSNLMFVMRKGGPVAANRKQRRHKVIDRTFTKKGYRDGVRIQNGRHSSKTQGLLRDSHQ